MKLKIINFPNTMCRYYPLRFTFKYIKKLQNENSTCELKYRAKICSTKMQIKISTLKGEYMI